MSHQSEILRSLVFVSCYLVLNGPLVEHSVPPEFRTSCGNTSQGHSTSHACIIDYPKIKYAKIVVR